MQLFYNGVIHTIDPNYPAPEAVLVGKKPDEALFSKAGEAATQDCNPIDDFRGSASYRRAIIGVLTKRTLDIAYRQAVA